jgi:hypothetical protein
MLSGCLNCPGLDALESFLEELVDDESENISYNVCMYVLHLYPALSQKDQMTAECATIYIIYKMKGTPRKIDES